MPPYFRGDAAFASPEMYEYLEAEGFLYAIHLPKNQILRDRIAHFLTRPVGRPPNHVRRYCASFSYRAKSGDKVRLQLHALAYRLGNFLRTLALPQAA